MIDYGAMSPQHHVSIVDGSVVRTGCWHFPDVNVVIVRARKGEFVPIACEAAAFHCAGVVVAFGAELNVAISEQVVNFGRFSSAEAEQSVTGRAESNAHRTFFIGIPMKAPNMTMFTLILNINF